MQGVSLLASQGLCSTELTELVPKICDLFFFYHHIFHLHMSWLNTSLHINYVIPSLGHREALNHSNFTASFVLEHTTRKSTGSTGLSRGKCRC